MYFEGLVLEKHTNMIVFNNKMVLNFVKWLFCIIERIVSFFLFSLNIRLHWLIFLYRTILAFQEQTPFEKKNKIDKSFCQWLRKKTGFNYWIKNESGDITHCQFYRNEKCCKSTRNNCTPIIGWPRWNGQIPKNTQSRRLDKKEWKISADISQK